MICGNEIIGQVKEVPTSLIRIGNVLYSVQVVDKERKELLTFRQDEIVEAEPYVEPEKIIYEVMNFETSLPRFIELESEISGKETNIIEFNGKLHSVVYVNRIKGMGRLRSTSIVPIKAIRADNRYQKLKS